MTGYFEGLDDHERLLRLGGHPPVAMPKQGARDRAEAIAAARAAVVEAAKAYVDAPAHHSADTYDDLKNSVDHLRRLERDHA